MVTGATSGIGFSIAERFLQEGASSIILVGRSQDRLQAAAARLRASTGVLHSSQKGIHNSTTPASDKVRLLVGDVAEAGSWMRELEREMTVVDILVNAAGISVSNILPKSELEDISKILRTNLEGAMLTSRALMRAAIRSRVRSRKDATADSNPPSKCIINISSLLALKAGTGAVPYAASKAGLLGLTRSLAVEASASLRHVAIRSNVIVPGYIETPMISDFTPGEVNKLKDIIPLHRFGDPREIADAAVFLAQNEYANNCVLNIDGGLSAV
ncbi:Short-chain dehydrogenase/reductase SDR [Penicillium hispanicum]|uniref:Short-chain dehydrogenase/reductase SDR n=1 Tax=Penicillium hispanicum TaxID=1080232 RepID=UPI0025408166|nr:Short-chain dehydrogenase/reductase SDR [Penicillium hispanicum]KAJ5584903.1 Short-chain dehydrogenase/reductase SDR [Penicillium hispanicum]